MANAAEYFGIYPVGAQKYSTAPVSVNSGSLVTVATLSSGGPYIIDEIWFANASGANRFVNQVTVTVDGAGARDVYTQTTADDFPLKASVSQLPYKLNIYCNTITVEARASGANTVAWIVYRKVANKVLIPKGDKMRYVTPAGVGGGTLTSIAGSITSGAPFIIDSLYLSSLGTGNKVIRQIELTVDGTARDLFNDTTAGDYTISERSLTRYDIDVFASTSFDIKVLTDAAGPGMAGWFTYKVM